MKDKVKDYCSKALWSSVATTRKMLTVFFKGAVTVIGPVMIVSANFLVGCVAYGFLYYIIPEMSRGSTFLFFLNVAIGLLFLVNILFNYMACAFTPPGSPKPCTDPVGRMGGKMMRNNEGEMMMQFPRCVETQPAVSWRWCRHCKCIKPPRAHHDSVSGKCVYDMDHYCPWMNNCVGKENYRHFMLFLFYLFFGALWAIGMTWQCIGSFMAAEGPYATKIPDINLRNSATFSFTIALSAAVAVGILFIWHVYLCLTNQTTIEFYINMDESRHAKSQGDTFKNPFDKGWRKNLVRVFGDGPWYSYLMISLRSPIASEYGLYPPVKNLAHSSSQDV